MHAGEALVRWVQGTGRPYKRPTSYPGVFDWIIGWEYCKRLGGELSYTLESSGYAGRFGRSVIGKVIFLSLIQYSQNYVHIFLRLLGEVMYL